MRISDWSSDVCSSDLGLQFGNLGPDFFDMPQGRAAHFGAGAVLVAVKRQKVAALFYRKAKPPRPGDETQVVDVPVSIIAKAIVAAKWGDEADILILANGLGWQPRTLNRKSVVLGRSV